MALDVNGIAQIKLKQAEALSVCRNDISTQLDGFREILTNINTWSNETVVGQNVGKDMVEILNEIIKMIESTDSLCKALDDFCNRQEQINAR